MTGTSTTYYPSDLSSVEGGTTTRYIYGNGELLATIEESGVATSTTYYHSDHLGSTRLVTNTLGVGVQVVDYYPYGGTRIENGPADADRMYIGEFFDSETSLSYLNARYYNGTRGQFVSQDPVFWELAQTQDGMSVMQNPQAQNSYSYAQNNPIVYKDPDGRIAFLALLGLGALANVGAQALEDGIAGNSFQWQNYAGAAVGGAVGAGALLLNPVGGAVTVGAVTGGTEDLATQFFTKGTDIDYQQTGVEVLKGGVFGQASKYIKIPSVTSGRNSLQAITNSTYTKVSNGTIQNFSGSTGVKVLTTQTVGNAPQSVYNGGSSNKNLQKKVESLQKQLISLLQKKVSDLKKKLGK